MSLNPQPYTLCAQGVLLYPKPETLNPTFYLLKGDYIYLVGPWSLNNWNKGAMLQDLAFALGWRLRQQECRLALALGPESLGLGIKV